MYTVDHIENLIDEYTRQLAQLVDGTLTVTGETLDQSITRITALKDTWEGMIYYHDVSTLPHYCLCNKTDLTKFFGDDNRP